MNRRPLHPLLLSLLSGVLLFAAWPVSPLTALIFVAFVPLLWLEQQATSRKRFFGWTYLTMVVWNFATTWWVLNSTLIGGISAILPNALLMSIPWIAFYNVKKKRGDRVGYAALILFWLTFEYIHLNWELSWPWLTLGNVFASRPDWVQWYEFTGTSGGSLWVMLVNLLIFLLLRNKFLPRERLQTGTQERERSQPQEKSPQERPQQSGKRQRSSQSPATSRWDLRYTIAIAVLLIVPLLFSRWLIPDPEDGAFSRWNWKNREGKSDTIAHPEMLDFKIPYPNIVIVQPNVDPWDEKFVAGKEQAQLQKLIRLSESRIDSNTALVVWPETAVPVAINEDEMKTNYFMAPLWDFMHRHPSVNLLTGMEGFRFYDESNKTPYSSKVPESNKYVDEYNSAVIFDSSNFQVYHKSKLVPGPETLPSFLKFMSPIFDKFGGTTGGYARQSERTVLRTYNNSYRVAPAVCYESIYGEFMSQYVRNGADLIVVITNDGWWGNTAGYKQHESYARLRAIETRRWVARSANTGVSCFIDPTGKVIDPQPWDKTAVIKRDIPPIRGDHTFYVKYGDILSRLAVAGTILLIGWWLLSLLLSLSQSKRRAK